MATITQDVTLNLTNVAVDSDPTSGTVVANGIIKYTQSVTGTYSPDGKTFTPTSYGNPTNISVSNLKTSEDTSPNPLFNTNFGTISAGNTVNTSAVGNKAFDNVGLEVENLSNSGFNLKVYMGSVPDDSSSAGTGSPPTGPGKDYSYDVLNLNLKENQVPLGTPIPVDSLGRVDFVNSININSGTGASIKQYDYQKRAGVESYTLHSSTPGYAANASSSSATIGVSDTVVCYVKGTHFKTSKGDVKVEDLQVGDMLLTIDGQFKPVVWTGFSTIDCRLQTNKEHAYPVRISAHAFGSNLPTSDLYVSPLHSIYVSGVMIPAIHLINGVTITQDSTESLVTYYHVELPTHDVVYAEGLPAETYLDTTPQNRQFFAQGNDGDSKVFTINTQFPTCPQDTPLWQYIWDTQGYAPLIQDGPILDSVRATLNERAVLMQENNRLAA